MRTALTSVATLTFAALVMLSATTPAWAATPARSPRLELTPARIALQIAPGFSTTVQIKLVNNTGHSVRVSFGAIDLEAGDRDSFAQPASGSVPRSAVEWFALPSGSRILKSRASLRLPVRVKAPHDATPGAYATAVVARQSFGALDVNRSDSIGSRIDLHANLASTFVFVVPGDAKASLHIGNVNGPRLVWGSSIPRFEADVTNDGDTLLNLEAAAQLSAFGTFASRDITSRETPTLPDGQRTLQMDWTDRPLFGWFVPTMVVVGGEGSGVREERTMPGVLVLPPWWMLALLATALAWPLWGRRARRSRRASTIRRGARVDDSWDDDR